jgi:hypothetical protein
MKSGALLPSSRAVNSLDGCVLCEIHCISEDGLSVRNLTSLNYRLL